MAAQLSFEQPPTEALLDQAILKHISIMKAEFMTIHDREVAGLKKECQNLKQQLSMLQMQEDSHDCRSDDSSKGKEASFMTTDSAGGKSVDTDGEKHRADGGRLSQHVSPPMQPQPSHSSGSAGKMRLMLQRRGWRAHLQKVVLHPAFEGLAITVVMLNVTMLGVETNQMAKRDKDQTFTDAYFVIEMCCCAFFIFEVGLRILANWRYFFYGPGWVLNLLDFVLVGLQIAEISVSMVLMGQSLDDKRSVNFSMWRVLRLARVIRLFRSARLLVIFAEVRSTTLAVILALKPLSGAMLVMLLLCYSFSIILIELAHEERLELEASDADDDNERLSKLEFHFGSLGAAIVTLLHCSLTSSASYGFKDVSALFTSWWVHDLLVPFFMVLSILGMLNIITGIFVDSTTRQVVQDQQNILESIASEAFDKIHCGATQINQDDFLKVIDSGKCDKLLEVMELDKHDVRNLWSLICFEADLRQQSALQNGEVKVVNVDAIVNAIVKMSGGARRIDLLLIFGMFEELAETAGKVLKHCALAEFHAQSQPHQWQQLSLAKASI